jgi:UDP-N-acetylglucosamine 1-carboxyvinyltransferase
LLTNDDVILHNIPQLGDVYVMLQLLSSLGVKVKFEKHTIRLKARIPTIEKLAYNQLTNKIRYSTHLIGALLPQFKEVKISLPGGCVIGTRRLDSHLLGFKHMGAKITVEDGFIKIRAEELHGCQIRLKYPSVGATENLMIAACLAKGVSVIENVAKEPEIVDLANFINSMGGKITGAGTSIIRIQGVDSLSGTEYTIIPDRIETGTYIVAAAITHGELLLKHADISQLEAVVAKFRKVGICIDKIDEGLYVMGHNKLNPVDIVTEVYPGFPTDMQPIATTLLSIAKGQSSLKETIYDSRFTHVPELLKMGADIAVTGDTLLVTGVEGLRGAETEALDIRMGGSLILAGLCAKGKTLITGVEQIFRGYETPIGKLQKVGAKLYLAK